LAGGFRDRDHGRNTAAGMSITFWLSTGFVPELFAQLPSFLQPLFSNPLAATTILGIIFYQLFHVDTNLAAWLKNGHRPFFYFFNFLRGR
jgi:xanthine/uracil permease